MRTLGGAALAALLPQAASACAVCFGSNEALASGLNWGIGILLSFTCLTVGGITWAVVKVEKSRAAAEAAALAQVPAPEAEPKAALAEIS